MDTSDEERWHYYTDRRRKDDEDMFSQSESNTVIPRKAADNVNRTVRNRNNNRGRCSGPGSENDTTSDENSSPIDRRSQN